MTNPFIILAATMAALAVLAWLIWPKIGRWFSDSETLFWARLQMAAGTVWGVLVSADLMPVLSAFGLAKWTPVLLLVLGIIGEIARRSRATDL